MFREIKIINVSWDGQFFPEGGHYSLVNYVLGGTIFSEGGHYSLVNFVRGGGNKNH